MGETAISDVTIRSGVLRAWVTGTSVAGLVARVRGSILEGLHLSPAKGGWHLELPLGPEILSDGVEVVELVQGDRVLHGMPIAVGDGALADLANEVAVLRAELDLLKGAFRRHCRETDLSEDLQTLGHRGPTDDG